MEKEIIRQKLLEHQQSIQFFEQEHEYWENGIKYDSVVRRIRMFQKQFDSHIIAKMCSRGNNPKYTGRHMTEIALEWETIKQDALRKGRIIHKAAERIALGEDIQIDEEFKGYIDQVKKFLHEYKLDIIQTEQIACEHTTKIAGTVDMVTYNTDGTISIWDWKSNKEDPTTGKKKVKWLEPLDYLPREKASSYSVQLCIYKALLERLGFIVKFAAIVYLAEDTYRVIPAVNFMGVANFIIDGGMPKR